MCSGDTAVTEEQRAPPGGLSSPKANTRGRTHHSTHTAPDTLHTHTHTHRVLPHCTQTHTHGPKHGAHTPSRTHTAPAHTLPSDTLPQTHTVPHTLPAGTPRQPPAGPSPPQLQSRCCAAPASECCRAAWSRASRGTGFCAPDQDRQGRRGQVPVGAPGLRLHICPGNSH